MAASNTRFTQNSLGQSKNPIDSDHGIYRDHEPTREHSQPLRFRTIQVHPKDPLTLPLAGCTGRRRTAHRRRLLVL